MSKPIVYKGVDPNVWHIGQSVIVEEWVGHKRLAINMREKPALIIGEYKYFYLLVSDVGYTFCVGKNDLVCGHLIMKEAD